MDRENCISDGIGWLVSWSSCAWEVAVEVNQPESRHNIVKNEVQCTLSATMKSMEVLFDPERYERVSKYLYERVQLQ